jgi:hypothetical protein
MKLIIVIIKYFNTHQTQFKESRQGFDVGRKMLEREDFIPTGTKFIVM